MLKISNVNLELSSTSPSEHSQIAEQYLANEVLPRLRNSTTGKAFFGRYFGPDDIISDALEHTIPILRNPSTWERENRELSDEDIKKIVDKIVAWTIRRPSYGKAKWEATKGKEPPREVAETDLPPHTMEQRMYESSIGEITPATDPSIRVEETDELKAIRDTKAILWDKLSNINPKYGIILKHLLNPSNSWYQIISNIDQETRERFTPNDAREMIFIIENINKSLHIPTLTYIIRKVTQAQRYASGDYYRKQQYNRYTRDKARKKHYLPNPKNWLQRSQVAIPA